MLVMSGYLRDFLKDEDIEWIQAKESARPPKFRARSCHVQAETLSPAILTEGPLRREELIPGRVIYISYQPDPRRNPGVVQWGRFVGWKNRHFFFLRPDSGPKIACHFDSRYRYRVIDPRFAS